MKTPPIIRNPKPLKICYDCDHELYPNGKIVYDDPLAKQIAKGEVPQFGTLYLN
jgi:hypothetical protein